MPPWVNAAWPLLPQWWASLESDSGLPARPAALRDFRGAPSPPAPSEGGPTHAFAGASPSIAPNSEAEIPGNRPQTFAAGWLFRQDGQIDNRPPV